MPLLQSPEMPCVLYFRQYHIQPIHSLYTVPYCTVLLLTVTAGIYEDPSKGWIEGSAIIVAVLIVALVTAGNNYNKVTN